MPLDCIGETIEPRLEIGMLGRLHQAEMARGSEIVSSRGSAPKSGMPFWRERLRDQQTMALAGDAVEDDAGDPNTPGHRWRDRGPPPPPSATGRSTSSTSSTGIP